MISAAPIITTAGKALQIKALAGESLIFTKFKVGSGTPSGSQEALTDLVTPQFNFGISSKDDTHTGYVEVKGVFDNSQITTTFQWKELGLFAMGSDNETFSGDGTTTVFTLTDKPSAVCRAFVSDTAVTISSYNSTTGAVTLAAAPASGTNNVRIEYVDDNETLYAYCYDANGGNLVAGATDVTVEQEVGIVVAIGSATSIIVQIAASAIYATKTELEDHTEDTDNPHEVTASQVGLGNVPNVSTNNQTPTYSEASTLSRLLSGETLSVAFGKLAKGISSIIDHIANTSNPHGVTASQAGLGNVPNVTTNNQTPTYETASTLTGLSSGETLTVAFGKLSAAVANLITHLADKTNPHEVELSQTVDTYTVTLTAGQTGLTIYSTSVSNNSFVDIYTDRLGMTPKTVFYSSSVGGLVITFEAQPVDVVVKVRIS